MSLDTENTENTENTDHHDAAIAAVVQPTDTGERAELLGTLETHRRLFLVTARGLTDDQAQQRSTVSALTIGGLVKHVTATQDAWTDFMTNGADALAPDGEWNHEEFADQFAMVPDDTLAALIDRYEEAAGRTVDVVNAAESLDVSHELPAAPWFPPGAHWSIRRVLLHLIAETAQHAGHADIIRESIDGATTMA